MSLENSKYHSTIYRVSAKAIIKNDDGHVLMVQEGSDAWTLPGGGVEHGETEHEALARELVEEANISAQFTQVPLGIESVYVEKYDQWVLWVFYEVSFDGEYSFEKTDEVNEIRFRDPNDFSESDNHWEKLMYKWVKAK